MLKRILLVEDNDYKRARVRGHLQDVCPQAVVDEARSFSSGCKLADETTYDLAIMDMSLPTHDRSPSETGGKFRALGGREIARKIMRRAQATRIVFVTQYDSFSDAKRSLTLTSLNDVLRAECRESYAGLIYFDTSKGTWKDQLTKAIFGT